MKKEIIYKTYFTDPTYKTISPLPLFNLLARVMIRSLYTIHLIRLCTVCIDNRKATNKSPMGLNGQQPHHRINKIMHIYFMKYMTTP